MNVACDYEATMKMLTTEKYIASRPPDHIGLHFKMNWYTQQKILEVHILHCKGKDKIWDRTKYNTILYKLSGWSKGQTCNNSVKIGSA